MGIHGGSSTECVSLGAEVAWMPKWNLIAKWSRGSAMQQRCNNESRLNVGTKSWELPHYTSGSSFIITAFAQRRALKDEFNISFAGIKDL